MTSWYGTAIGLSLGVRVVFEDRRVTRKRSNAPADLLGRGVKLRPVPAAPARARMSDLPGKYWGDDPPARACRTISSSQERVDEHGMDDHVRLRRPGRA